MKNIYAILLCTGLFVLPYTVYSATEPPAPIVNNGKSFDAANKNAKQFDDNEDVKKYRAEKFYPYLAPRMGTAMQHCFKELPHGSMDPFAFIISLDAMGKITRIDIDKPTDVATCLTKKLAGESFAKPPVMPFVERIDMAIKP